jgi:uncharacterized protein
MRALALLAALAAASQAPIPPSPARHVTDGAGFLTPAAVTALDTRLVDYEQQSGHQILVWIGDTLGDSVLEDWSIKTFTAWKVGQKKLDDGLVLFIFAKDHKLRIEVGYGLEGEVPDARAKQIVDDTMTPLLRAGKNDEAVGAGVDAILTAIEGHPVGDQSTPTAAPARAPPLSTAKLIFYGIIGLAVLLFAVTHPRLALFFLMNIMSGGRGGGWGGGGGGGGGGFSGGGGGGGGGGASGSW